MIAYNVYNTWVIVSINGTMQDELYPSEELAREEVDRLTQEHSKIAPWTNSSDYYQVILLDDYISDLRDAARDDDLDYIY